MAPFQTQMQALACAERDIRLLVLEVLLFALCAVLDLMPQQEIRVALHILRMSPLKCPLSAPREPHKAAPRVIRKLALDPPRCVSFVLLGRFQLLLVKRIAQIVLREQLLHQVRPRANPVLMGHLPSQVVPLALHAALDMLLQVELAYAPNVQPVSILLYLERLNAVRVLQESFPKRHQLCVKIVLRELLPHPMLEIVQIV